MKTIHKYLLVSLISLGSLLLFWLPFILKLDTFWGIDFSGKSMQTVVANFDGINFLVVAKTLYDPHKIEVDFASILSGRRNLYFSAHYPGFPLMIKVFDVFLSGPNALLASIALSNLLLGIAVYAFFKLITKKDGLSLYLAAIALFIPARILSMRGVGSNESLFIVFVLSSLIASAKEKPWISGILGALAVLTRSPGILLFIAYMGPIWLAKSSSFSTRIKNSLPYLLIPGALCSLWVYYGFVFHDFLAYFKVGGNINLYFPPFMVFATHFDWVSGMWLEDIIYTYLFYGIGIILFWKNFASHNKTLMTIGYFGIIYASMLAFIVHRDIARYALPIAPIAIAGFSPYLESKYFKIGLIILIIPVFLFSWNFILNNFQPIMDWSPLL